MKSDIGIIETLRTSAAKRILFLPHAIRQMARPERLITTDDIRRAIFDGVVIEDYAEDVRGHSCLTLGFDEDGRAIHVVCQRKNILPSSQRICPTRMNGQRI